MYVHSHTECFRTITVAGVAALPGDVQEAMRAVAGVQALPLNGEAKNNLRLLQKRSLNERKAKLDEDYALYGAMPCLEREKATFGDASRVTGSKRKRSALAHGRGDVMAGNKRKRRRTK